MRLTAPLLKTARHGLAALRQQCRKVLRGGYADGLILIFIHTCHDDTA